MHLTDTKLRAAKPDRKPYKIFDTGGLFIKVTPTGGKLWRFRFKYCGKEKLMTLGGYPEVGLIEARRRRDAALGKLEKGIDPTEENRKRKAARSDESVLTFEKVARDWHENRKHEWTEKYATQVMNRLEADLFSQVGTKPIAEIEPPEMLAALRVVEARGVLETTRRLKQYSSAIFRFGIASGYCRQDPASPLKGALKTPPKAVHHKTLAQSQVGEFLQRLDHYNGDKVTRIALQLALLTATRTIELRSAKWIEFEKRSDPAHAIWRIPPERMKMRVTHLVPLSRQSLRALSELQAITGRSEYLFPGPGKEGFMSNNTMLYGLYRMGYHSRATTHGFRGLFSTEANEHGFNEDWIERQLAHDERDEVRAAYNAAQYLPQRRELLQWWADHLDALKNECAAAEVVQ